jgi:hypothetical protein
MSLGFREKGGKGENKVFTEGNFESNMHMEEVPEIEENLAQKEISRSEIIKDKVFNSLNNLVENDNPDVQKQMKKNIIQDLKEVLYARKVFNYSFCDILQHIFC